MVVFSPTFVVDTKIILRYDFVAPLKTSMSQNLMIPFSYLKYILMIILYFGVIAVELVWNMVNIWPKQFLCYPLSKIGVFGFLISWIFRKKKQRNKKSWFLVNSRCFCFAFHANLMSDGKKKRLKFLFITPLILSINMSISLFWWTV